MHWYHICIYVYICPSRRRRIYIYIIYLYISDMYVHPYISNMYICVRLLKQTEKRIRIYIYIIHIYIIHHISTRMIYHTYDTWCICIYTYIWYICTYVYTCCGWLIRGSEKSIQIYTHIEYVYTSIHLCIYVSYIIYVYMCIPALADLEEILELLAHIWYMCTYMCVCGCLLQQI